MHDALTLISEVNQRNVKSITVLIERLELQPARIVSDTRVTLECALVRVGRDIVVRDCNICIQASRLSIL